VGSTPLDASGRPMPFRRTSEGVAIITIVGELVNRGAWIGASSGLVSYEGISHQLSCAAADPQSRSVLLDIESPGGEAVGAFECAAMVRKAAAIKPVIAVVNGMACSAGYSIASGATRIITTPTGLSGSIGVVMMHMDYSKMLAGAGVEPTFIFAGDHKVDGNPYEPLPDDIRAAFQSEIDAFYGLFLQTVAAGRGARMTQQQARATQARVFMGEAAVWAGLADAIMTFDEAVTFAGRAASGLTIPPAQSHSRGANMTSTATESPLVAAAKKSAAQAHGTKADVAPLSPNASPIVRAAHRAAAAQLAARARHARP
jgi:signal peptide peptidase SppA